MISLFLFIEETKESLFTSATILSNALRTNSLVELAKISLFSGLGLGILESFCSSERSGSNDGSKGN